MLLNGSYSLSKRGNVEIWRKPKTEILYVSNKNEQAPFTDSQPKVNIEIDKAMSLIRN